MSEKKNYKVVCVLSGSFGQELAYFVYYYRWYWAADLRSWFMFHIWGCSCNTYVRDGAKVKPRPVVWLGDKP
jgi:hypothetical protein